MASAALGYIRGGVALVTGAGRGIGKGVAISLARKGACVGIADLDLPVAIATAEEINHLGGKAFPLRMDVTNELEVNNGIDSLTNHFGTGRLDILVANAGIQHISPVIDLEYSAWKKIIDVHLGGSFLTTKAAMKKMMVSSADGKRTGGSIIYIGSVHSKEASVLKAPYVTAKHGIIGLMKTVAKEGGPYHIRANTVCPGFVLTDLVLKQIPEQAKTLNITEDEVKKNVMLKSTVDAEFTTIDEVAEAVCFLADQTGNAITGQSLTVSHGWNMA